MTLGMRTRIGSRPHRVAVVNPGSMQPDGDGGYINVPSVALNPWWVSIESATAADLQNAEADTVIATKVHIVRGQYRNDITTKSQLRYTDLDGRTRTFDVNGIDNVQLRNFELVVSCTELESPPPPPPSPPNVLDSFNRPNESPLSNGGMWLKPPTMDFPLELIGNQAASSQIGQAGSYWAMPYAGDFEVYATVGVLPEPGNSSAFGIFLTPDPAVAGFVLAALPNSVPPMFVLQLPSGARPSNPIPGVLAEGDLIGLGRSAGHYIAKLQQGGVWVPVIDEIDSSTPEPLYPGLWIQNYVPSALTRLDDFSLVVPL